MKKISIKMRITLWYAALMTLLVIVVLGLLFFVSGYIVSSTAQESLVSAVESNIDEVEYDDGELEVDEGFAYSIDGVTLALYSSSGVLLKGYLPQGLEGEASFEDGTLKTIESGGRQYFLYDRLIDADEHLWVRGVVAADGSTDIARIVLTLACFVLPLVVIIGAVVGYQITKRSFKPIDAITQAANKIAEDNDLSRRIELDEGRDEIHRLAETFNYMFSRLEASFEEEKRFTSDVSHELRTPTSVIMSQCEYALAHVTDEKEYRETIEVIKRQIDKMSRLIAQLLSFTRMEQGTEKMSFENTDLSQLVNAVCDDQSEIGDKGIKLIKDIPLGIMAVVDGSLIARLLSNLIGNAYQYGRPGGGIWVTLRHEGAVIRLSVADNGIGIPQDALTKIWNRFYQVDPSRTPTDKGSMGLGLAMVDQIARLHGGHMELVTELERGTTVVFVLPVKP